MGWPAGVSRLSGSPSRGEVREYRELRRNVEELVGRINGRFTDPGGDVPVHYELDDDRRRRIERMAACVVRRDVYWWTEQELAAAEEARRALAA
jgi:trehalose-6-phosphate synthase